MLTLDGSTLEGGGQLVRVALSLSAITAVPVHITRIRWNRGSRRTADGGLKESHLAALQWLAGQSGARVDGAHVGSREVVFRPGSAAAAAAAAATLSQQGGDVIELVRPGSVFLVWQAIFPYVACRIMQREKGGPKPWRMTLRGGTNVPKAMSGEYVRQVWAPLCEKLGLPRVEVRVARRGWAGSAAELGEVHVEVYPTDNGRKGRWPRVEIGPAGTTEKVHVTAVAGSEATRDGLLEHAVAALKKRWADTPVTSECHDSGNERRVYVLVVAHMSSGHRLGRDALGTGRRISGEAERRRIVREVAGQAVRSLIREVDSGRSLDEFAEDQIEVFRALAEGGETGEEVDKRVQRDGPGSLHAQTARWVCGEILERDRERKENTNWLEAELAQLGVDD